MFHSLLLSVGFLHKLTVDFIDTTNKNILKIKDSLVVFVNGYDNQNLQ